uniref:Uncharacterized protein n=1 Tax=Cannabis sativa TaxID=3483 RepID=A0A803Q6U5_CANSA
MVATCKTKIEKTPQVNPNIVMEDVTLRPSTHAQPSHVMEGDTSEVDNRGDDPARRCKQVEGKDPDVKDKEEEDEGHVKDSYYKDDTIMSKIQIWFEYPMTCWRPNKS